MFTYRQIQAMREHRFDSQQGEGHRKHYRDIEPGSLHELLMAVAAGLARIGIRHRKGKVRPGSPAY